jgi:hypothetical protein
MFGPSLSIKVKNNCGIDQGFGQQLFAVEKYLGSELF